MNFLLKTSLLSLLLLTLLIPVNSDAQSSEKELFLFLTTSDAETQMMALVLATQSVNQNVPVRILLCSGAGELAIAGTDSPSFEPSGRSPKQLLAGLLDRGVRTDVCGIFLPNRDYSDLDLIDGVGIASPPDVAAHMKNPDIRFFTF